MKMDVMKCINILFNIDESWQTFQTGWIVSKGGFAKTQYWFVPSLPGGRSTGWIENMTLDNTSCQKVVLNDL